MPICSRFAARPQPAFAALLVLCAALLSGCAVTSSGSGPNSPVAREQAALATGTVAQSFFGLVVKNPAAQPTVTAGARRLWDSGVTWAALEPAPGSFDWSRLDAQVEAAEQSGASLTLTLGMTPTWASSDPGAASAYGYGAAALPARIADWDRYVAAAAARYKGRIAAYELWNNPEDPTFWSGPSGSLGLDLAALAQHAAAAIHTADSAALLVSPALSPAGLQGFLAAGGGASIDVVGAALNLPGQTPEAGLETLQALRAATAGTAADAKPIWNDSPAWTLPAAGLDAPTQAAYTARALIMNAAFAVGRMHWYAWDDVSTKVVALTTGAQQPTAAAQAYAQVEAWLAGAQLNGCAGNAAGLWTCQLVQAGHTQSILWSAAGTVTAGSLGAASATAVDGSSLAISADGSLQVGASPVLLQ